MIRRPFRISAVTILNTLAIRVLALNARNERTKDETSVVLLMFPWIVSLHGDE